MSTTDRNYSVINGAFHSKRESSFFVINSLPFAVKLIELKMSQVKEYIAHSANKSKHRSDEVQNKEERHHHSENAKDSNATLTQRAKEAGKSIKEAGSELKSGVKRDREEKKQKESNPLRSDKD